MTKVEPGYYCLLSLGSLRASHHATFLWFLYVLVSSQVLYLFPSFEFYITSGLLSDLLFFKPINEELESEHITALQPTVMLTTLHHVSSKHWQSITDSFTNFCVEIWNYKLNISWVLLFHLLVVLLLSAQLSIYIYIYIYTHKNI